MKKLALLYIVLVVLLLSVPAGTNLSTDSARLGNTPGNTKNEGVVAEDEEFVYYATYGDDKSLYKASKDFSNSKKISESIINIGELNVSGEYIYYTDGFPGFLRRMKKDGTSKRILNFTDVGNVIVNGNRIYYRLSTFDDNWGNLYSCDLTGGRKKLLLEGKVNQFCVDGNMIYYIDSANGYSLWRMDVDGNNRKTLWNEGVSAPEFDEKYVYFTANNALLRMDKETLQTEVLKEAISEKNVYGEWIYYSENGEKGLRRMSRDGRTEEMLLNDSVYNISVAGDSVFFRLTRDEGDYYRLDLTTGRTVKLPN